MPNRNRAYVEKYGTDSENLGRAYQRAVAMANLKDEQLLTLAKADAHRDDKYKKNTYAAALIGLPAVDTFVSGAFSKAPKLAGKLGTMGKTAAGWGGAFALAGLYGGMVNKVSAVSPVVRNFEDKHPVIKSLLTLAGFAAVLIGAHKGVSKVAEVLPKKFPEIAAGVAKLKSGVAETINNSKLSTKIAQPLKAKLVAFAQKHPRTAGTMISGLALSVPVMLIGTLYKMFTEKSEKAEQIKDTYKQLAVACEMNRQIVSKIAERVSDEPLVNAANALANKELNEAKEEVEAESVYDDESEYDSDNGHFD